MQNKAAFPPQPAARRPPVLPRSPARAALPAAWGAAATCCHEELILPLADSVTGTAFWELAVKGDTNPAVTVGSPGFRSCTTCSSPFIMLQAPGSASPGLPAHPTERPASATANRSSGQQALRWSDLPFPIYFSVFWESCLKGSCWKLLHTWRMPLGRAGPGSAPCSWLGGAWAQLQPQGWVALVRASPGHVLSGGLPRDQHNRNSKVPAGGICLSGHRPKRNTTVSNTWALHLLDFIISKLKYFI